MVMGVGWEMTAEMGEGWAMMAAGKGLEVAVVMEAAWVVVVVTGVG